MFTMIQRFHGNLFKDTANFIELACVPFLIEKVVKQWPCV